MALVVDVSSSRQILKPLAEEYRDLKEIRIRNGHTINDFMIQRITMNKIIKGVEEAINSHQSLIRASNVCLPNENQTILLLDNKSLEIEKAISLLTRFKDRFQNEEHIYNSFLNTLRSKTIEELHREVATNCQNHQDLLEEFEHFISPHSSFTRVSEGPSSLDSFLLHGGKGCVVPSKRPPWMLKAVKMCMRPEFNQNVDLNKLEYDKKKGHEMKKNKTKGRRHVIVDECDISKSNIITHSSVADKNTGMREGCWSCQKWEEHFYWDHLKELSFHFMKVMDGDFSRWMEFPLKFSKNFRVDLLDVIALQTPTGQTWEIGFWKEQDRFYFKGGWKQFIEANKIEQDHTLIFKYSGDSSFMVQMFDQTGCVRVASDFVVDAQAKQERSSSSRRICENAGLRINQRVGSSRICKQGLNDLDSDSRSETNTNHVNSQVTVKILQLNFDERHGKCFFIKLITPRSFYRNPYMPIPCKFLAEHIRRKPYGITICNQSKKKWFVKCKWSGISWGFCGESLLNFLRENNFKEGDACLFKLKEKSKKVVMEMSTVLANEVDSVLKKFSLERKLI